jgi:hypothetical protein
MLITPENHLLMLDVIEDVYHFFLKTPGALLTEDDLKCQLFCRLSAISAFSAPIVTLDQHILATSVHTEVSWFDARGKLTVKPDITILDPQHLSLLYRIGSVKAPPSKQFHFDGSAYIFELKFVRGPKGITKAEFARIQKDFEKIERLFSKLKGDGDADNVFCYFVVFSRYGEVCDGWDEFCRSHYDSKHWKLLYKSLDLVKPKYGRAKAP